MGNSKKWCLVADLFDPTLMRNTLAMDFARNMGMDYISKSEYVEVYFNGVNQGVYRLCTPVSEGKDKVDYDLSMGNVDKDYYKEYNNSETVEENYKGIYCQELWFMYLMEIPEFVDKVYERFYELQPLIENLTTDNEMGRNRIDNIIDEYGEDFERNFTIWSEGKKYGANAMQPYPTFEENVEFLRKWIINRNEWLKSQWQLMDNIGSTGYSKTIYLYGSYEVEQWMSDDEDIAVVNNGKIKALKSGNVTITADTGKEKFICEVEVKEAVSPRFYEIVNEISKEKYDSTDSYAAVFLSALWKYYEISEDKEYLIENKEKIKLIMNAMLITLDRHYTYSKPDY